MATPIGSTTYDRLYNAFGGGMFTEAQLRALADELDFSAVGGIVRAANIAGLRDLAPPTSGNWYAIVDGYTTAADGGGGTFDWNAAVTQNAPGAVVANGSVTVTGIPAGTPLFVQMGVAGLGIPSNATVASIVSPTSVTLSIAATVDSPGGTPLTFNLVDDSCINIKPSSLTTQQPGRWIRRLDAKVITLEMAGGKADYVFPVAGIGEALGTDNSTAMARIGNGAAYLAASPGRQSAGFIVRLGAGNYRFSTSPSIPSGIRMEGSGSMVPNTLVAGNTGPALFTMGSVIALEPTAFVQPFVGAQMKNLRIIRRGLDLNPTYAQVVAWNAAMAQEVAANQHWTPLTPYAVGAIVMNLGRVYYCDTGGTSGAANSGGPEAFTTSANSIADGTVNWHFLNQYTWNLSTPYGTVGTLVCNGNRIYMLDTAGTSSSANNGPTATTTGVNTVTDGTCKWHFVGTFSCGVSNGVGGSTCAYEDMVVVGFARGFALTRSASRMKNVYIDCFSCLDVRQAGDLVVYERVHCLPMWLPTNGSIPDTTWKYKLGVGIFVHDQMDGAKFYECEVESWQVGLEISNVWQVSIKDFLCETPGAYGSEASIKMRNICSFVGVSGCYTASLYGYDIQATDDARASTPNPGGETISSIQIDGARAGGDSTYSGPGGATSTRIFRVGGASLVTLANSFAAPFSGKFLEVLANIGGTFFLNAINCRVDGPTTSTLADFAIIDATNVANVSFSNVWAPNAVRNWIIPPGYDNAIDVLNLPASGGSHTIAGSTQWIHMTPSVTLAAYTITMPAAPLDMQDIVLSTTNTITTLTLNANSGQSISGAITTLAANTGVRYRYRVATSTWYKVST